MKKLILLMFIIVIAISQMKYLKNSDGNVFYVSIKKGIGIGDLANLANESLRLETLIIEKTKVRGKIRPKQLLNFISKNSSTIRELKFVDCKFDTEYLVKVISALNEESVLKSFSWEDQKSLDDDDYIHELLKAKRFWGNLEYLSLKNTELDNEEEFFLDKIIFSQLKELNLSNTEIDEEGFQRFVLASKNYPVLEKLHLDELDIVDAKTTEMSDSLKWVSIVETDIRATKLNLFLENNYNFFRNLNTLKVQSLQFTRLNKPDRYRVYKTRSNMFNYNLSRPKFSNVSQEFKHINNFGVFYSSVNDSSFYYDGFTLTTNDQLINLIKHKKNYLFNHITVFGNSFTSQNLEQLVSSMNLHKISLVNTIIDSQELKKLEKKYSKTQFISLVSYDPEKAFRYNNMFQQMHMQQMMMQQMQMQMQMNIPSFGR